jgi:hypothetical protein
MNREAAKEVRRPTVPEEGLLTLVFGVQRGQARQG